MGPTETRCLGRRYFSTLHLELVRVVCLNEHYVVIYACIFLVSHASAVPEAAAAARCSRHAMGNAAALEAFAAAEAKGSTPRRWISAGKYLQNYGKFLKNLDKTMAVGVFESPNIIFTMSSCYHEKTTGPRFVCGPRGHTSGTLSLLLRARTPPCPQRIHHVWRGLAGGREGGGGH